MAQIAKIRPRSELIMLLIQPLASAGVGFLAKWQVNPLWVVLSHAVLGFVAAFLLTQDSELWWLAALMLQLKTLLDNMDGGLARVTGQITLMGRYFDTGMDFLVNIALFIALSSYGSDWLCWLAFVLLTLILSLDFNAERLYKQAHFPKVTEISPPIGAPQLIYQLFKGMYTFLFTPQDRFIGTLDKNFFRQIAHQDYQESPEEIKKVWSDLFSTATIVNLGLSTQMFILGLCIILHQPYWYVYSIYVQAVYVGVIQILRAIRLNHYMQNSRAIKQ